MHIDNLYMNQDILLFRECYAMEKIHGTSAHISWKNGELKFFAGGVDHANFIKLFEGWNLKQQFKETFINGQGVVVFGEAYGGKCQGMKDTYGPNLRFVVFEVKVGDSWLNVPNAQDVANKLGLEFIHYTRIPTDLDSINTERDADSIQAIRNGIGSGKIREGIVLRPLIELVKNNGERIISKHKRDEFRETKTPREVDPERRQILDDAESIADEWVTPMRLSHILQNFPFPSIKITGDIIKTMVKDVIREASTEIVDSKDVRKAIGRKAAELFKQYLQYGEIKSL